MHVLFQPQGLADGHFFKLLEVTFPPVGQLSSRPAQQLSWLSPARFGQNMLGCLKTGFGRSSLIA